MANGRWLRMKKISFSLFLLFILVSCVSQRTAVNTTPTNNFAPTSTSSEPVATFTPVLTATPITSNKQDLDVVLTTYLNLSDTCKKIDRLSTSDPNIIFSEISQEVDNQADFVSEVAESANNKYSAYILQSYALDIMSDSIIPIYCEDCGKVYLENDQDGKRYEINWRIFPPGISMIYDMIWIDDNILVVREAQNEGFYLVLGIDVTKQEPVYFSEVSCSSK